MRFFVCPSVFLVPKSLRFRHCLLMEKGFNVQAGWDGNIPKFFCVRDQKNIVCYGHTIAATFFTTLDYAAVANAAMLLGELDLFRVMEKVAQESEEPVPKEMRRLLDEWERRCRRPDTPSDERTEVTEWMTSILSEAIRLLPLLSAQFAAAA